ncbi:helix-turn-helix domain-containing protein [Thalassospira alkalitolerans]|uniref:helix-turn-helix domain-containing protein n=1 Tax=Thalassospira alkalitolerans TaxID=1293890 RepID=UPI003AA87CE5
MIEIPLPFVVALFLAVLLARLILRGPGGQMGRAMRVFVGACLALVIIVGLRWQFDLLLIRVLRPVFAAMLPPIAWKCFAALGTQDTSRSRSGWPHIIPVIAILIGYLTCKEWPFIVDFLLMGQFAGYGFGLLFLASRGEERFAQARLGDVGSARGIVAVVGGMLILSAVVDGLIALDFSITSGANAPEIVSYANLIVLLLLAVLMAWLGRLSPARTISGDTVPETVATTQKMDLEPDNDIGGDDDAILSAIDAVMTGQHLYRDPDLTLDRLARRVVIPARQISGAINRRFGRNVSQIVNEYRIAETKILLHSTEKPVTEIMFDCGFQTKSNFNREFGRITGTSPRAYRAADSDRDPGQPFGPIRKLSLADAESRE